MNQTEKAAKLAEKYGVSWPEHADEKPDNISSRYKIVMVSPELLGQMFTVGNKLDGLAIIKGLPPGAKFIRAFIDTDHYHCAICLVFEHPDFEEVEQGHQIPDLDVVFQREYKEGVIEK